jgi:hypothetical protein
MVSQIDLGIADRRAQDLSAPRVILSNSALPEFRLVSPGEVRSPRPEGRSPWISVSPGICPPASGRAAPQHPGMPE